MTKHPLIAGKRNERVHVAAHEPSGYGVRALCGVSWREGDFRVITRNPHLNVIACRRCLQINGGRL